MYEEHGAGEDEWAAAAADFEAREAAAARAAWCAPMTCICTAAAECAACGVSTWVRGGRGVSCRGVVTAQ